MSVLQKIRDKYAVVIVVVICLSIVGFLLQEAFFGRGSLGGRNTAAGQVNGEEIDINEYNNLVSQNEDQYRQQMGGISLNDETREQIRQQAWNQLLSQRILDAQYKTLGIDVTNSELDDQLTGKNVNPIWAQHFTDQNGQFDRQKSNEVLAGINKSAEGQNELLAIENQIIESQKRDKYFAMIRQAAYMPNWMANMQLKDNSNNANISYVSVPYTSIADSTVKVTDGELQAFIDSHKPLFKTEDSRKIEYMVFDATPSSKDTAAALKELGELKAELDTTKDVVGLINRNSDQKFFDGYVPESKIMVPEKDSILRLSVGQVFGPYYDNNEITYAKMVDRKQMPDSVVITQIGIAKQSATDSAAKKTVDSVEALLKGGANMKALAASVSQLQSAKQDSGEATLTPMQQFPADYKPMSEFVFNAPAGAMKVIDVPGAYMIIKINQVKNIGPAVKIAYLARTVESSSETNSAAFSDASAFAGANRTQEAFNKSAQEKGTKRVADGIRPMDYSVRGLGTSRDLVKWAYTAKVGEVSNVFSLEDKYVVAVLTEAVKAGTASLSAVRPAVELAVKRQKKAAQITAKLNNPASLDAAAKASNQPVMQAEGINFSSPLVATLGLEPRVVGASFNKALGTTKVSAPIEGNAGVYVIKVDGYTPAQNGQDVNSLKASYEQSLQSTLPNILFDVLKEKANVKDTRSKFM
ncbi:hypothetical protein DCC81_02690 [Chitinophaga parva]|uniref:PpiC domain-containing protein n=1 Tax=Chitinophaga parva TaxID=2169414 RepID=A0A2T7BL94_9BACT|nr:peptidylprolyl isomerase [Chitinophaga parva]PUZ28410.1 hypothetical protein DCC81_02690 [Chitinophaga parva]